MCVYYLIKMPRLTKKWPRLLDVTFFFGDSLNKRFNVPRKNQPHNMRQRDAIRREFMNLNRNMIEKAWLNGHDVVSQLRRGGGGGGGRAFNYEYNRLKT